MYGRRSVCAGRKLVDGLCAGAKRHGGNFTGQMMMRLSYASYLLPSPTSSTIMAGGNEEPRERRREALFRLLGPRARSSGVYAKVTVLLFLLSRCPASRCREMRTAFRAWHALWS